PAGADVGGYPVGDAPVVVPHEVPLTSHPLPRLHRGQRSYCTEELGEPRVEAMSIPLVLIHGHPFDHTMWNPQLEAFSPSRRVIAPDLRGYGASPAAPEVTRFE